MPSIDSLGATALARKKEDQHENQPDKGRGAEDLFETNQKNKTG